MWSFLEAERTATPVSVARGRLFAHNVFLSFLLCVGFFFGSTAGLAQGGAESIPASSPAPQAENQNPAELSSHDEPTTFKVNVKMVLVRAVVRDAQGHAVGNLHKEDFQVFDKGKPQVISQFDVEQLGAPQANPLPSPDKAPEVAPGDTPSNAGKSPDAPQRFVAYMFDDIHIQFGDLAHIREAAERHLATLRPTDRAAIFTTSGQGNLDFTDDHAKLHEALLRLRPRPTNSSGFGQHCPEISFYQADRIVNKHDVDARNLAIQDAQACAPHAFGQDGQFHPLGNPAALVDTTAEGVLAAGQEESNVALSSLRRTVQHISTMPGQRSVVLASPGFIIPGLEYQYDQVIDQALRSQVVINALDARGLYVIIPGGDASHQPAPYVASEWGLNPSPVPMTDTQVAIAAASANADVLTTLAEDTGGVFFRNNNDFDEGFRRVAQAPEFTYVLAFTPQNLKLDGGYHTLKVKLNGSQKLTLQARRGYYAPKTSADPNEQAKVEIEDEMFSQEELHNLPVKLQTQFFKASEADAKLTVLAHVDVQRLHFRKAEGRNDNVLTCVSALFDRNGHFLQGTQKVITMHWKDETLEHKLARGITLKTSFDVKPGNYLVRLVVRDAEGQMMSAENGTVEIR